MKPYSCPNLKANKGKFALASSPILAETLLFLEHYYGASSGTNMAGANSGNVRV